MEGDSVYITGVNGKTLELRTTDSDARDESPLLNENGHRKLDVLTRQLPRTLGTGVDLVGPEFWKKWEEIERDWDENVIPNLWMNRDDEQDA